MVVSIAQFVEVTKNAVLGGVVELVSSNPTMGTYFSAFSGIVDALFHSKSLFIINLYQFLITPNIHLISPVFSESGRLSLANGIDTTRK